MQYNISNSIISRGSQLKNEKNYTFFYDETNNIRKFFLKDNKFNTEKDDNWVLGGIYYDTNNKKDFEELFSSLNLHKNIQDVKFKHIASGDMPEILNSDKLKKVLEWCLDNVYLHYINVDIWYWSVCDIVDSVKCDLRNTHNRRIKDIFYKVINNDKWYFVSFLNKYNYPNINRKNIYDFKMGIKRILRENLKLLSDEEQNILNKFLKAFLKEEQFGFITNEKERVLIQDFMPFYAKRIHNFKESIHILDEELLIKDKIVIFNNDYLSGIQYSFVKSQQMKEIQLSDIIVGFLGKYFTYIRKNSIESIQRDSYKFFNLHENNIYLLNKLISKSVKLTPYSIENITSDTDIGKSCALLQGEWTVS